MVRRLEEYSSLHFRRYRGRGWMDESEGLKVDLSPNVLTAWARAREVFGAIVPTRSVVEI